MKKSVSSDSIFRLQLERIVKRASDLVVERQQKAKSSVDETVPAPAKGKHMTIPPRGKTE